MKQQRTNYETTRVDAARTLAVTERARAWELLIESLMAARERIRARMQEAT